MPPTTNQESRLVRIRRRRFKQLSSFRPNEHETNTDSISHKCDNVACEGTFSFSSCDFSSLSKQLPARAATERRRSSRGNSSLFLLAQEIVQHQKQVVFITGAGISVASGIPPFRGPTGVWAHHIWTNSTREAFRRDPLEWYNSFWLPCLGSLKRDVKPNVGHETIKILLHRFPFTLRLVTQNIDGLHSPGPHTIEAHGRVGLFKCLPEEDSDSYSDSDTDDDRSIHLGHRRKYAQDRGKKCPFRQQQSLTVEQIEPVSIRENLKQGKGPISQVPICPICNNVLAPQALLFDEGYHSHDFYRFRVLEDWLSNAEVIVFVGTSFAVRLPEVTLNHARSKGIPVYNFNTLDMLEPSVTLNANNIRGPSEVTLPLLLQEVEGLQNSLDHPEPVRANQMMTPGAKTPRLRRSSRRRRPMVGMPTS